MKTEWITTFFLTCYTKYITQEQVLERFTRDDMNCRYIIIGALEYTENNEEHYHVIGALEHSIRKEQFKRLINDTIHIEPLRRFANAYEYITKVGMYFSNYESKVSNEDIYNNIINEIEFGVQFRDLVRLHPKFMILNYDKMLKVYTLLTPNKEER